VEVGLDRPGENAEDLAVEEIEDVCEKQKGEDPPAESPPLRDLAIAQKFTPSDSQTWRGLP
jgi:hypothetical protein